MVQTPGTVEAAAARLRLSGRVPTAAATLVEIGISDTTLLLARSLINKMPRRVGH